MKPLFFGILRGLVAFTFSAFLLLSLLTFIALKLPDPKAVEIIFPNAALFLSAFISGRFAVSGENSRLISGISVGLADTLAVLIISLIFFGLSGGALLRILLTAAVSLLGALSKKTEKRAPSVKKRKLNLKRYAAYR